MEKPRIGVTLGDPAGIGPEVALKAMACPEVREACRPVLIGEAWSLERVSGFVVPPVQIREFAQIEEATERELDVPVLSPHRVNGADVKFGQLSAEAGTAALAAIEAATALAMEGRLAAVV